MNVVIRNAVEGDHAFIYATYIRNRWFDKDNKSTLKRSTWSGLQHKRLEDVLAKANSVKVACIDEDPDHILGYGFIDGKEPYTYVKLAYRSPGLNVKERLLMELKNA